MAVAMCMVALVTGTCYAALVSANVSVFLDGVDSTGNPSSTNGANSSFGKSFKETNSGIIVQIASAVVTNQFGHPRIFSDRGLTVTDPSTVGNATPTTFTATNDIEVVSRPFTAQSSFAVELAVYNPADAAN